jgi:hypothetical protein
VDTTPYIIVAGAGEHAWCIELQAGAVITSMADLGTLERATHVPHARVPNGQSRSLTGTSPPLASTIIRAGQPLRHGPIFQAGHAGSIPVIRSTFLQLRWAFRYSFLCCMSGGDSFVPHPCHEASRHASFSRCSDVIHGPLRPSDSHELLDTPSD